MICPACKTKNTDDSNYCKECGAVLKEHIRDYQKNFANRDPL